MNDQSLKVYSRCSRSKEIFLTSQPHAHWCCHPSFSLLICHRGVRNPLVQPEPRQTEATFMFRNPARHPQHSFCSNPRVSNEGEGLFGGVFLQAGQVEPNYCSPSLQTHVFFPRSACFLITANAPEVLNTAPSVPK